MKTMSEFMNAVIAVFCLVVSGITLLYLYAFASMIDPQIQGMDRWLVLFEKMFGWTEGLIAWPMLVIFLLSDFLLVRSGYRLLLAIIRKF